MANTLTWRDVAAPDFNTGLRAINTAGANISQGFDTIGNALGNFQTYRQGQAANEVLNNAAGFSDPTKLRSAIADGSLFGGIDRSLVTPQTLAALNAQPGTLLDQGLTQERLTHAQQIDPLLTQGQGLVNQHQAITNQFDTAADPLRLKGLALTNSRTAAETGLTGAQTKDLNQRTDQSGTSYARGTQEYDDQQAAVQLINQLKTQTNTPDDVQNLISSPAVQALSPGARQNVVNAAQSFLSGSPAPAGAGPGTRGIAGAAGAIPGSQAASPFTAIPGYMAQPGDPDITTMKIGDVQNYQTNTLLKRSPGPGLAPATSIGAFQINRDTITQYGPKALGSDWKNQVLTPENQDKIARAIFEDNKNGNLKDQWSSLPNAKAGAYKDKTWEEMRPVIMAGETGAGPGGHDVSGVNQQLFDLNKEHASYAARASVATGAIDAAVAQASANNINEKYSTTQKDTSTVGEVVAKVVGTDSKTGSTSTSAFRDLPQSRLVDEINRIKQMIPGATAATAMAIMEAHPEGAGMVARTLPNWLGGHPTIPDVSAIDAESAALNNGTTFAASKANQGAQALSGLIASAQKDHEDATFALGKALHNTSSTPEQLAGYRNKVAITRAILDDKLKAQKDDPTLNFVQNTPSPGEQKATPALQDAATPPPATVAPVQAPASRAINAAVSPSSPAFQAAKQRADETSAALDAAEARNDPNRNQYQDAAEAADRALNDLIAAAKPKPIRTSAKAAPLELFNPL